MLAVLEGTGGIVHIELSSENGEAFFLLVVIAVGMDIGGVGRTVAVIGGARMAGMEVRGREDVVVGVGKAIVVTLVDEFIAHLGENILVVVWPIKYHKKFS